MAAVATIEETFSLGGTGYLYRGTIAFDSSYPTGGETIDPAGNSKFDTLFAQGGGTTASGGGYVFNWDAPNQKLVAYRQKDPANAGGADIPLTEVSNTTDLSALVSVPFIAIGQ